MEHFFLEAIKYIFKSNVDDKRRLIPLEKSGQRPLLQIGRPKVNICYWNFDVTEFLNRRMWDKITNGTITLGNKA